MHIFFNMFALYNFGSMVENTLGSQRFLKFYLICGLGASLVYMGLHYYSVATLQDAVNAYLANPNPTDFANLMGEYGSKVFDTSSIADFVRSFEANPTTEDYIRQSEDAAHKLIEYKLWGSNNSLMIGASGAVFGVMMGFALLYPDLKLVVFPIPVPIKALYYVLGLAALETYFIIMPMVKDNVAHSAHLGGLLFAYIIFKVWRIK